MKDKLKEVLEKVDPNQEIFTESVQNDFVAIFEAKMEEKETEIQKLKESHEESLARLDEVKKEQLNEAVESLKEEHKTAMTQMDEDHADKMQEIVEHIDVVHYNKMKSIFEAVDADRAKKLVAVQESIDEDHTAKMQNLINMYESSYQNDMVDKVSDYLDVYLEEVLPEEKAVNMAQMARLTQVFEDARKLFSVTDEFVSTEIKEAVEDAQTQLDEKVDTINELMLEKIALTKSIARLEAKALLSEKTANMTDGEKAYITKFFENADVDTINGKLDEAVRAYENDMTRKKETLRESAKKTEIPVVEAPKVEDEPVLNESVFSEESMMETFVSKINKSHQTR